MRPLAALNVKAHALHHLNFLIADPIADTLSDLRPDAPVHLVRNGIEAKGRSWPREREGRPFSASALAFSESWMDTR